MSARAARRALLIHIVLLCVTATSVTSRPPPLAFLRLRGGDSSSEDRSSSQQGRSHSSGGGSDIASRKDPESEQDSAPNLRKETLSSSDERSLGTSEEEEYGLGEPPKEEITCTGEIAKAIGSTVHGGAWNADEDESSWRREFGGCEIVPFGEFLRAREKNT